MSKLLGNNFFLLVCFGPFSSLVSMSVSELDMKDEEHHILRRYELQSHSTCPPTRSILVGGAALIQVYPNPDHNIAAMGQTGNKISFLGSFSVNRSLISEKPCAGRGVWGDVGPLHVLLHEPAFLAHLHHYFYLLFANPFNGMGKKKSLNHLNSNDLLIIDVLTRAGCLMTLNNHPNPVSNCLTF